MGSFSKSKSGGGGGATTFLALSDTPSSYIGEKNKVPFVNPSESALIFKIISILAWKLEVENKIKDLYEKTADVVLTTTGSGDLQTAINNLLDDQILEIKTNAVYSPIQIPSGKKINIRTAIGYNPIITGSRCIQLMNGVADVIISGITIDSPNNTGGNNNYQGSAISFGQHQTIVNNVIFHNIIIKNNVGGSAVMLSYHWSISGDNYANPPQLSELSEKIAFVDCDIFRGCKDGTEGANISIRGIKQSLFLRNVIDNYNDSGRGIQAQGVLDMFVEKNKIINIGGGNAEGVKVDEIGTSPFEQTCWIKDNYVDKAIEGIDIDDNVSALVENNICIKCSDEGISLDDSSTGIFNNNVCYDCGNGIRFEVGSLGYLSGNNCFNNKLNNYFMENGYIPDLSNISDSSKYINQSHGYFKYKKTLTEATLVNITDINVMNNTSAGIKIKYMIEAINTSTNIVECHYGEVVVIVANQNGTISNAINHIIGVETDLPIGTGIIDTWAVVNGTLKATLNLTATSGITPTSLILYFNVEYFGQSNYTLL